MSRVGAYAETRGAVSDPAQPLSAVKRSGALRPTAPIDARAPKPERALEQLDAPTVEEELSAALFEDCAGAFADPALLRPAGVKAVLEELQRDLADMQAVAPEDLIELALGVLEDELKNAEALQQILQRMGGR